MQKTSVEAIVRALNQHQVQYLIVGGLAVVAHGHVRFTADVDLLLAVDQQNLTRAVEAIKSLDYRPRAPVPFEQFIDPAQRRRWAAEKNMVVFFLASPKHPATEIDLFLEPPIDFAATYANAVRFEVAPGVAATFCSLDDLIKMKTLAGRARDSEDIKQLRNLRGGNQR
ncbi:MAG TPA: DUF6036 family nucleotidyltransferase [Tepidisphaeraceae bacterium]|nr:DUF6036 family nucleotidyltransferase [Tepidisphaeraceae bacterium]